MGKLYDFTQLIKKYSTEFTVLSQKESRYDGGIRVDGETVTTVLSGAVVPLGERKLYQSGGAYTSQDRSLYMFKRIPQALMDGKVLYKGDTYSIEEETEYSDFADVFIYTLRRVNVND
jgi:hypothetical protein